jgi:hypothetical protein
MPQRGYINMNNKKENKDHNNCENQQRSVLGIDRDHKQDKKPQENNIVNYHSERNPQVGYEEAFEDARDGRHGGAEGDGLGGVEGGDGEDDGGGGEEREGEEEDKVEKLEDEEFGPLGGLGGSGRWVGVDLGEERVGEEGVSEDGEGEGED